MRALLSKLFAVTLTFGAIVALVTAVRSHAWYATGAAAGYDARDGVDPEVESVTGLWDHTEFRHGERSVITLHALAAERADAQDDELARDLEVLWIAGIAVMAVTTLSIFALGFCLVSAHKRTRLERRISPRGLATLALLGNLVVVAMFITHMPEGRPTTVLWAYLAASVVGMLGADGLARAFPREDVEAELPRAVALA